MSILPEHPQFDIDGVYDPSRPNDRLLLGLKGTMSEFELTLMRRRPLDAALAKARRGELRFGSPSSTSFDPLQITADRSGQLFVITATACRDPVRQAQESGSHFARPAAVMKLVAVGFVREPRVATGLSIGVGNSS